MEQPAWIADPERLRSGAGAQDKYPYRPIRYISPYAPGGITTVIAHLIGQQLIEAWGQQVVVDNGSRANTLIVMSLAAKAPTDGYTLVSMGVALAGQSLAREGTLPRPKGLRADLSKLFTATEIARIRSRQDCTEQMELRGSDTLALGPKEFPAFIQQELALWESREAGESTGRARTSRLRIRTVASASAPSAVKR